VHREDLAPVSEQRLVGGPEVAHGRLRGGGQRLGRAQLLEELVVVGDVGLGDCPVAAEDDVERHHDHAVLLGDPGGEVAGAVRDDRDLTHGARQPTPMAG
jgi:hypothetical protein